MLGEKRGEDKQVAKDIYPFGLSLYAIRACITHCCRKVFIDNLNIFQFKINFLIY